MFKSQQRIRVPRTELKHELSCKNLLIKDETRNILASLLLGRSLNKNRNQRFSEYTGGVSHISVIFVPLILTKDRMGGIYAMQV